MIYRLAPGVSRIRLPSGPALLSRAPLRVVRVNDALAALLAAGDLAPSSLCEARALDALFEKGLVLRERGGRSPAERLPRVTVIVPVKDRAEELRRCLESLRKVRYPADKLEVVVADDGSRDHTAEVAAALGAEVVRSGGEGLGPAAARNRGAAAARGEILAFLDSDCTASPGWLSELEGHFADPEVVAVGGGVDGLRSASALERYEAEMSSLSLGRRERSGRAGNDTFYLPSCNLLVRRAAFAEIRGFREDLHIGEDVDLAWRLRDRGGRIVYTPAGRVRHAHRCRLLPFLRRRFDYGTSEGPLHALHPARRKQLLLPPALTAGVLLAACAAIAGEWPLACALGPAVLLDAAWMRARLVRRGLRLPLGWLLAARLRSLVSLVYHAAFHLWRYYGLLLLPAGLLWPRLGLLSAALALGCAAVDHRARRPRLAFLPFLAFSFCEHLAYGAGVFAGCLRQRSFASYRPSFVGRAP